MKTKLQICKVEEANPGQVYLYPEGLFYKAYQKSAWLLCTRVHPFKVSSRPLKGLDGPLLSVGFPQSSLAKFAASLSVEDNPALECKILRFGAKVDFEGYQQWMDAHGPVPPLARRESPFNSLPVYGLAYRLAVELTEMAARLDRNYRYSLGEDIRRGVKQAAVDIMLAGKGIDRGESVHSAFRTMLGVQLSLRLLNDLKILPDKRYVYFMELTEDIVKQLSNWERSLSIQKTAGTSQKPEVSAVPAGVPSPP